MIQWGSKELTSYTGTGLEITFLSYTNADSYAFLYGGIDYSFNTSTKETAQLIWTKSAGKIEIMYQQRDVPSFKVIDWFTIGY